MSYPQELADAVKRIAELERERDEARVKWSEACDVITGFDAKLAEAEARVRGMDEALRRAHHEYCACGGSGPDDPNCCTACLVYHHASAGKGEEHPPLDKHLTSGYDRSPTPL